MAATAPVHESIVNGRPEQAKERAYYALSFGSTFAHLWWGPGARDGEPAHVPNRGFYERDLVCGMLGARAEFLARLWQQGIIPALTGRGLLAPLAPVQLPQNRYPFALRLVRTPVISYGYEWSGEMWRDATLLIIDLF